MQDRNRAFTVIELMVSVTILTIIVAAASVGYSQYRDKAAMLVDETNQKVLLAAVKLYAYDTNALPGSLSELQPEHVNRAYAQVTNGKKPYTFLAFLKDQVGLFDIAEAMPDKYIGGGSLTEEQRWKILTCPSDPTPPSAGGHSYGIHRDFVNADGTGKLLSWLLDPAHAGWTCIAESDIANPTDVDFARRHEGGHTYVRASPNGVVRRIHNN